MPHQLPACNDMVGNWVVLGETASPGVSRAHHFKCRCVCGQVRIISGSALKRRERKSCGCLGNGNRLRPYESLYNSFKYYARQRGIAVSISFEQFVDLTKVSNCHYCGAGIYWRIYDDKPKSGKPRRHSYNLDRKHSGLTYTIDNVVVCCKRCNTAKSNMFSYEEWLRIGMVIRSFTKEECNV